MLRLVPACSIPFSRLANGRESSSRSLARVIIARARDVLNLPHFSSERSKVGDAADERERRGAIQVVRDVVRDKGETAVVVDSYESAVLGSARSTSCSRSRRHSKCRGSAQGAPVASRVMRLAVSVPLTVPQEVPVHVVVSKHKRVCVHSTVGGHTIVSSMVIDPVRIPLAKVHPM